MLRRSLGLFTKILLISLMNFFGIFAAGAFAGQRNWAFTFATTASLVLLNYVYLIKRIVAWKYVLPGVLFLLIFHAYPAALSGYVSLTNHSNGHMLLKSDAIRVIVDDSYMPNEDIPPFKMQIAKKANSDTSIMVLIDAGKEVFIGSESGLKLVPAMDFSLDESGGVSQLEGYRILRASDVDFDLLESLSAKYSEDSVVKPIGLDFAEVRTKTLNYDKESDTITEIETGKIYRPNKTGSMVSSDGSMLIPGWREFVGFSNYLTFFNDPNYSKPLVRVISWTVANAVLSLLLAFFLGFFLTLVMNFEKFKAKRFYQTLFIIPFAAPFTLMILVWRGLLQEKSGLVNTLFGTSIDWLGDPWIARGIVLMVEVWASFPFMVLITTAAISAISKEIIQAAQVDGASSRQIFNLIQLPLTLKSIAPILVTSFSGAFSGFAIIYLLTQGGPTFSDTSGVAGATDILISYTYKLAFYGGESNNYGLASAASIINFIFIAIISVSAFKQAKQLDN
jgi:arabinogalactan oligomer/maltooligosaccharide transport system permease protein